MGIKSDEGREIVLGQTGYDDISYAVASVFIVIVEDFNNIGVFPQV